MPEIALLPDAASAIQLLGRLISASRVPLSAVAHVAGGAPERMRRIALVPMFVSMASRRALRTATES